MATVRFDVLDLGVEANAERREIADGLLGLTSTFAKPHQPPTLRYDLIDTAGSGDAAEVRRNDERIYITTDAVDLLPAFELDLYRQILESVADRVVLHAAAIDVEGTAIVLVGASGAGKSTLALALAERGARYMSDEWAVLQNGQVVGVPRPINIDPCDRARVPESFGVFDYQTRSADGESISTVLVKPPESQITRQALPIGAVVFIEPGPDPAPRLVACAGAEAFQLLCAGALQTGDHLLDELTSLLEQVPLYCLTSPSPETACDVITAL